MRERDVSRDNKNHDKDSVISSDDRGGTEEIRRDGEHRDSKDEAPLGFFKARRDAPRLEVTP